MCQHSYSKAEGKGTNWDLCVQHSGTKWDTHIHIACVLSLLQIFINENQGLDNKGTPFMLKSFALCFTVHYCTAENWDECEKPLIKLSL